MASSRGTFENSVFLNCPFDIQYFSLLRPLLFTIIALGYNPKIASERSDSGELRLKKIAELIESSRYSIHDLSRLQAAKAGEFFRMNMPFELGIDYGCRLFGQVRLRENRCLVLVNRPFDYAKAVSDLAGVDVKSHGKKPEKLVQQVRNWFVETAGERNVPSPARIWYGFNEFAADFYDVRKREGFSDDDLDMMPVPEYTDFIRNWLRDHPLR